MNRVLLAALTSAIVVASCATGVANARTNDGGLLGLGGIVGSNCPTGGTQVFSRWNDSAYYYLAPNGGFENGSTGWLLGGAYVALGNEPFYASGSHSLALPSGSRAASPVICLGPQNLAIRMFGSDAGGSDSGLHVQVTWYGLLNTVLGITDYDTFAPGGGWGPTDSVNSSGGLNVLVPLVGSTSARVQISPNGSGSNWRIDDLYIDPWASRCC